MQKDQIAELIRQKCLTRKSREQQVALYVFKCGIYFWPGLNVHFVQIEDLKQQIVDFEFYIRYVPIHFYL